MKEVFGAHLTHGLIGWIVSQEAIKICEIKVIGVFIAVGRCLLPAWLIFSADVCFWYPGSSHLINARTVLAFSLAYEQYTWKLFYLAHCGEAPMLHHS